jgi:hypothetical protein
MFCPALGRAITFLEVDSRYSNREKEFVYLENDLELIRAAIGGTNWKRQAKGKLRGRARGEHGRLLPLLPVTPNGNGHLAQASPVGARAATQPATPTTEGRADSTKREAPAQDHTQLATLDTLAIMVKRTKKRLNQWAKEFASTDPMPAPIIKGSRGRAHEFDYPTVRPWLERRSGRILPQRLPSWEKGN